MILKEVESSNNYAMALVKEGRAQTGQGFLALKQTQGKGRRGRQWVSEEGANVLLTLIQDMRWIKVFHQFQLSVATAIGLYDLVVASVKENVFLKWPNDLYIGDKKAAGILIENLVVGNKWQWAVIGVGVNVNQEVFGKNLAATSIKKITGTNHDIIQLAQKLKNCVEDRIQELKSGKYTALLNLYNDRLYKKNCVVKFRKGNEEIATVVKEVSPGGELITEDGNLKYDEIDWVK